MSAKVVILQLWPRFENFVISYSRFITGHKFLWLQDGLNCESPTYSLKAPMSTGICDS